jgi:hypothetical protein
MDITSCRSSGGATLSRMTQAPAFGKGARSRLAPPGVKAHGSKLPDQSGSKLPHSTSVVTRSCDLGLSPEISLRVFLSEPSGQRLWEF